MCVCVLPDLQKPVANYASHLNTVGFLDSFSVPVISWVDSIGCGWVVGEGREVKSCL